MKGIDVGELIIINVLTTIQLPLELLHLHNMHLYKHTMHTVLVVCVFIPP
jgi:hypothetical protein